MTSSELRQIIADALDGAAGRLRAGIVTGTEPERMATPLPASDPLSELAPEHDHQSQLVFERRLLELTLLGRASSAPSVAPH